MTNTDRVTQWRKNPSSEPHYICPNKCELLASIPLLPSPLHLLQADRSSGLQHLWDPQGAEPPLKWPGHCAAKLGLNKTPDTVQWFMCVSRRKTKKRGEWKVRIYHTRTLKRLWRVWVKTWKLVLWEQYKVLSWGAVQATLAGSKFSPCYHTLVGRVCALSPQILGSRLLAIRYTCCKRTNQFCGNLHLVWAAAFIVRRLFLN